MPYLENLTRPRSQRAGPRQKHQPASGKLGGEEMAQSEAVFHRKKSGDYLPDLIFGANDGIITTFAVVAGAWGAALELKVIIILGLANLLGDGLSMGLGNYLGKKTQVEHEQAQRRQEEWEVENLPEKELAEIREILAAKGFKDQDLDRAVEIISGDKKVWIDFMMAEELGIAHTFPVNPIQHGLAIFLAFALSGFISLLPFLLPTLGYSPFMLSLILSVFTLFFAGAMRATVYTTSWIKAGLSMLLVGVLSGLSAYGIGYVLQQWFLK